MEEENKITMTITGSRWQTAAAHTINTRYGPVTVPSGFQTDGASIPRFLWSVIGHPMTVKYIRAAIVHDYLYSLGEKTTGDKIFYDLLLEDRTNKYLAWIMYQAVKHFGGKAWILLLPLFAGLWAAAKFSRWN